MQCQFKRTLLVGVLVMLGLSMCLEPAFGATLPEKDDHSLSATLNSTIRATSCIENSTHCHCDKYPNDSNERWCTKPLPNAINRCYNKLCMSGYHCDCKSDWICEKVSIVSYTAVGEKTDKSNFTCQSENMKLPKKVVGQTTDFHAIAYQEFQIFVNNENIGYSTANIYKVFTAEIKVGDVIGLIAKRQSATMYGVKLRFTDLNREVRYIDENWFVSADFASEWLNKDFNPTAHGWVTPSIVNMTDIGFDSDTPWVWLNNNDTVYFRYDLK